jgi:prepilin-type N-terminal cleavage/methylation domain-containing protein
MIHQRRGFTLVELLVVIGIIAVLISLLIPVLSRARQHAVSTQCQSNLRQIGQAAIMYANENRGQFPCDASHLSNLVRFNDWKDIDPTPDKRNWSITRDAMLRCVKGNAKVFFCPANTMPVFGSGLDRPYTVEDFISTDKNYNLRGRFGYSWVANPWFNVPGNQQDLSAATLYAHQEVDPPVFDTTRPCKPGIDYLRKLSDKNAPKVAICVDQSQQANTNVGGVLLGTYYMHGTASRGQEGVTNLKGCWKNELFGDGHVDALRPDQIRARWAPNNHSFW